MESDGGTAWPIFDWVSDGWLQIRSCGVRSRLIRHCSGCSDSMVMLTRLYRQLEQVCVLCGCVVPFASGPLCAYDVRPVTNCVVNWLLVFLIEMKLWFLMLVFFTCVKLIFWFERCLLGFDDFFCRLWLSCSCKNCCRLFVNGLVCRFSVLENRSPFMCSEDVIYRVKD